LTISPPVAKAAKNRATRRTTIRISISILQALPTVALHAERRRSAARAATRRLLLSEQ
jgi:hypothetical protein